MNRPIRLATIATLGLVTSLVLSPPASAGDGDVERLYGVCVHCHGVHGEGRPELNGPRIGDLSAAYVSGQLRAYKDGTRRVNPDDPGAAAMAAVAKGLPDEVFDALGIYTEALTPNPPTAGPTVLGGAAAYARCSACHGSDARGTAAPSLLFQDPAYITSQTRNFRDGVREVMAETHGGLTDEQNNTVVGYIASLRPERTELNNYEVTLSREEGLAAFADIYSVSQSPRCMNCHPAGDMPLHTDNSVPHAFGIDRFSPNAGVHCSTCHAAEPVSDGMAPLPPADPDWSLAPKQMVFEGVTARQHCEQLKDPDLNGGRGLTDITVHVATDHLLMTSWHSGRTPPPLSHTDLVERFTTWGRAGGPCPE